MVQAGKEHLTTQINAYNEAKAATHEVLNNTASHDVGVGEHHTEATHISEANHTTETTDQKKIPQLNVAKSSHEIHQLLHTVSNRVQPASVTYPAQVGPFSDELNPFSTIDTKSPFG